MTDGVGAEEMERLTVLFVCTANICRSPALEFTAGGSPVLAASSAGMRAHAGSRICGLVAERVSDSDGGATFADGFRSRPIDSVRLDDFALVLTATAAIRRDLSLRSPSLRERIFTVREAIALSASSPDDVDRDTVARFGPAAALSRRRGSTPVAAPQAEGRRLFRRTRSTTSIDLPDAHSHDRGRAHLRGVDSALAAGRMLRDNLEAWGATIR